MNESSETRKIIKLLMVREGWWAVKFVNEGYARVGVPDVLACYNGWFVGLEFKVLRNGTLKYTTHQLNQCKLINDSGAKAFGVAIDLTRKPKERFALDTALNIKAAELSFGSPAELIKRLESEITSWRW